MLSTMFGAFAAMAFGLAACFSLWRRSERMRGEASIRATNAVLVAEARARMAAAEAGAPCDRDDLVRRLRARGEL